MSQKSAWENGRRIPVAETQRTTRSPESSTFVAIRRVIGLIVCDADIALQAECLTLVTGIYYEGETMDSIAARYGVTRAAVSHRCVKLRNDLGLPEVRAMRSRQNSETCRTARNLSLSKQ